MRAEIEAVNSRCMKVLSDLLQGDRRIVVLNADVAKSVGIGELAGLNSDRFLQMGISEQDMILTAAGMASTGLIPIVTTFAVFGSLRVAEQIRTFIAYPNLNVKIVVSHGGLTPGQDGVTHQAIEDIAILRAIPNMTVIEPFDAASAESLLVQAIRHKGPVYFRLNREKFPLLHLKEPVSIGSGVQFRRGKDAVIVAMGTMVSRAIDAAERLCAENIDTGILVIHTVKPIDGKLIVEAARQAGAIVTAEEHTVHGGLGDAVSQVVCREKPVPIIRVGINDRFAESGSYSELIDRYGLSVNDIVCAVREAVKWK